VNEYKERLETTKEFYYKTPSHDTIGTGLARTGTNTGTANLEICTLDGCAPCFAAIRAKDGWHA